MNKKKYALLGVFLALGLVLFIALSGWVRLLVMILWFSVALYHSEDLVAWLLPLKPGQKRWRERNKWAALTSTTGIAFLLSWIWVTMWLFVFLLLTWVLNTSTSGLVFISTLWVSVIAESVIRYAENHKKCAGFAEPYNPQALGQNKEYSAAKVGVIVMAGGFIAGLAVLVCSMQGVTRAEVLASSGFFGGPGESPSPETIDLMINNWKNTLKLWPVYSGVFASVFLRVVIYKRTHKEPLISSGYQPNLI